MQQVLRAALPAARLPAQHCRPVVHRAGAVLALVLLVRKVIEVVCVPVLWCPVVPVVRGVRTMRMVLVVTGMRVVPAMGVVRSVPAVRAMVRATVCTTVAMMPSP